MRASPVQWIGFVIAFATALALRIWVVDVQHADRRATPVGDSKILRSPGLGILQFATLEHALGAAEVVWLSMVQELDARAKAGEAGHERTRHWADIATDLDPHYFVVYHSAAVHLSVFGKMPEASDQLLHKAIKFLPERWELPFLLGYNEYFMHCDPIAASEWMLKASKYSEAPAYLTALAGRMRYQAGNARAAISMLESMSKGLTGRAKRDVEYRIGALKSDARLKTYDEACETFLEAEGRRPKDGAELYEKGLTREPPVDFFGDPIQFLHPDPELCEATTKTITTREYVAAGMVCEGRKETPVRKPSDYPDVSDVIGALLKTSMGEIEVELYAQRMPVAVGNFVGLAEGTIPWERPGGRPGEGSMYAYTYFFRSVPGFMIQGGGLEKTGFFTTGYRMPDEFDPELRHDRVGVLSYANTGKPDTNDAQFFITTGLAPHLDGKHPIFGQVTRGMEVVEKINALPTDRNEMILEQPILEKVTILRKKPDDDD